MFNFIRESKKRKDTRRTAKEDKSELKKMYREYVGGMERREKILSFRKYRRAIDACEMGL